MAKPKPPKAAPPDTALKKMRAICLSLPNTRETLSWGSPHFRVGDKIFSGIGDEKGRIAIGFKLQMDHADTVIQDPRFWRAPYVGKYGWVSMAVTPKMNWSLVKAFVEESYRLIAPRPKAVKAAKRKAAPKAKAAKPSRRRSS